MRKDFVVKAVLTKANASLGCRNGINATMIGDAEMAARSYTSKRSPRRLEPLNDVCRPTVPPALCEVATGSSSTCEARCAAPLSAPQLRAWKLPAPASTEPRPAPAQSSPSSRIVRVVRPAPTVAVVEKARPRDDRNENAGIENAGSGKITPLKKSRGRVVIGAAIQDIVRSNSEFERSSDHRRRHKKTAVTPARAGNANKRTSGRDLREELGFLPRSRPPRAASPSQARPVRIASGPAGSPQLPLSPVLQAPAAPRRVPNAAKSLFSDQVGRFTALSDEGAELIASILAGGRHVDR